MIRIYFYSTLVLIIAAFLTSAFIVESPKETRNRKLDEAIIFNFQIISRALDSYYIDNQELPDNLNRLLEEVTYLDEDEINNPLTGEMIEYKKKDNKTYDLCATFKSSNRESEYVPSKTFLHDSGYQCLTQKVRVDLNTKSHLDEEIRVPIRP